MNKQTEERFSVLEDLSIEIVQSGNRKKKKKNEEKWTEPKWDTIKHINMDIMGLRRRERKWEQNEYLKR